MYNKLMFVTGLGFSFVLIALALTGCGSSSSTSTTTTTGTTGISLINGVQPIFNANCVVCHQGSSPSGGLNLTPSATYQNMVNAASAESTLKLVEPGVTGKSYLINKLRGTQIQVGGNGVQMPYGASPLAESDIKLIEEWITAGTE